MDRFDLVVRGGQLVTAGSARTCVLKNNLLRVNMSLA
jgi:hypothetical protein